MSIHIKHYLVTLVLLYHHYQNSKATIQLTQHLRYCPISKPARSRTMPSQQKQPSVYTRSPSLKQFPSDSSLPRYSSTTKSLSPSLDDVTEKGEEEEEEEEEGEEKADNEAEGSNKKDKKKKQSKISAFKSFLTTTNKNNDKNNNTNDDKKKKDNESKTSPFASSSSSSSSSSKTTTTTTIDHLKSRLFIESGLNL